MKVPRGARRSGDVEPVAPAGLAAVEPTRAEPVEPVGTKLLGAALVGATLVVLTAVKLSALPWPNR